MEENGRFDAERATPGPGRRIGGWTILAILVALALTALVAAAFFGTPTIR